MNFVALKMLIGDRMKYLSLVAGLAFAALLVTQQSSIFTGFALQMGAWIRDTSVADLWVVDDQVEFVDDYKPMSETKLQRVRGIDGVEWAVPMYKAYIQSRLPDGTRVQTRVVGLDDASLTGAPPEMVEGSLEDLRRDRAVLVHVDQAAGPLAMKKEGNRPLRIGDHITINDNDAIVAGFYRGTREFFWDPTIYTTYSRALSWAPRERKQLTYVLVRAKAGQNVQQLADRIHAATGLKAYTNSQFSTKTTWDLLGRTGILVNFGITIGLGVLIGVLIAGQTFYTFILDNTRHFAALKAMGVGDFTLVRMIFLQVIAVGLVGFGIGVGMAVATGYAFQVVDLAFAMTWQIPLIGGAAILGCCLMAAMLSLVRVLKLEPSIVFRA